MKNYPNFKALTTNPLQAMKEVQVQREKLLFILKEFEKYWGASKEWINCLNQNEEVYAIRKKYAELNDKEEVPSLQQKIVNDIKSEKIKMKRGRWLELLPVVLAIAEKVLAKYKEKNASPEEIRLSEIKKAFPCSFQSGKIKSTIETAKNLVMPLKEVTDLQGFQAYKTIKDYIPTSQLLDMVNDIVKKQIVDPHTQLLLNASIFWMWNERNKDLVAMHGLGLIQLACKFEKRYGNFDTQIDTMLHEEYYIRWIMAGITGNYYKNYANAFYTLAQDASPYDNTLLKVVRRELSLFRFRTYTKDWDRASEHIKNVEIIHETLKRMTKGELKKELKHYLLSKKASLSGKIDNKVDGIQEQMEEISFLFSYYKAIYNGLLAIRDKNHKNAKKAITELNSVRNKYLLTYLKMRQVYELNVMYMKVNLEIFTNTNNETTYYHIRKLNEFENKDVMKHTSFLESDDMFYDIFRPYF